MPTVKTFIEQVYAQQVAGVSSYGFLDDLLYLEFGGYRPLSNNTQKALGISPTGESPISGAAPYWRVAAEPNFGNHSWEGHLWACIKGVSDRIVGRGHRFPLPTLASILNINILGIPIP
jgi:hypothetical protein